LEYFLRGGLEWLTAGRSMEIFYLTNAIPWFGAHTGYDKLPLHLTDRDRERTIVSSGGWRARVAGKALSLLRGYGKINQADVLARWRLERALRRHPGAIGHLIDGERHLLHWRDAGPDLLRRSVLTLHQPCAVWSGEMAGALESYRHLIVLWQREIPLLQSRLPRGKVRFIHHGVDTAFFSPDRSASGTSLRLLYAGVHLRNTAMLVRVVDRLARGHPELRFDLLVPRHRRAPLAALENHPQVDWHADLDDTALRDLYRRAALLLLPMEDSGANTAVVEALACGLPVVTTDVGGIRDYGGDSLYPLVANNDDDAMVELVNEYLARPDWRSEISRACRRFAEEELAWPLIAGQHRRVYREIAEGKI
jgi:glycosyltransferase involved in cell wall biosynthesis